MLLLKTAYHPNCWVTVDGEPAESLMLMPGYLGVQLAPGHHEVMVEYKSRTLRKVLMVLGDIVSIDHRGLGMATRRRFRLAGPEGPGRSLQQPLERPVQPHRKKAAVPPKSVKPCAVFDHPAEDYAWTGEGGIFP
ncbi:MAG TPA: hypothetical protein DHW65_01100 [Dehalococcoidia bacterium]|nr:hypothetical protein [SAR202 cluster bacterium]HCL24928.1 hypothetical protein [Dehalococcoidia bacterium]